MNNLTQVLNENPNFTLWEYLQSTRKPIIIYGMGDGAEKIISVLENKGIYFRDIFASDNFVRGHSFKGVRVKTFSEIKEIYDDFIILLAFAAKKLEIVESLYNISERYELYAPDVNVSGDCLEVFDREYYSKHAENLFYAYNLFEVSSRQIFCRIIDFKISGKLKYLKEIDNILNITESRYDFEKITSYADIGAYNGDTLKHAIKNYKNLKSAIMLEPDTKNYNKLVSYLQTLELETKAYNFAAWCCEENLIIHMGAGRNSTLIPHSDLLNLQNKKDKSVKAMPLDMLCEKIDLIKYDVEGCEFQALEGSKKIIQEFMPVLIISMYHNNNDIFELPKLVKSLYPYKLYLNRKPCIPSWETEIIAVSTEFK